MTAAASLGAAYRLAVWDFDGTLIPFDSEQYLLETLPLDSVRALGARLFVFADRRGWDPGMLKRLYAWCLAGTRPSTIDEVCIQLATHIGEADRMGLSALAKRGLKMGILSCGTADLSRGTLRAAGLEQAFSHVEANPFVWRDDRIAGIERRIYLPETKIETAARHGVAWEQVIAVGDGLTDLPLLDRSGLPILIASGPRAARYAGSGYRLVPGLTEAIALIANCL